MRPFLIFLLLFAVAALVSGLLTYPAWSLVQLFADQPIHRVMERVGMLLLAIATTIFLRRQGLANKAALGYGMPRAQFLKQMLRGLAAGLLLMLPLTGMLFALSVRTLSPEFVASDSQLLFVCKLLTVGLLTGLAVAFIEETFCRGAMFAAIERESGILLAILLPSLLYAATHFLGGKLRVPSDQVTYLSGLRVTAALFQRFATPLEFVDSFFALVALGILLAIIRIRTGAIAGCIGLHAGGVAIIWLLHGLSTLNANTPLSWLVGNYDGVIGWLMAVWITLVAAVYWKVSKTATLPNENS